jgi:hypothetical protein
MKTAMKMRPTMASRPVNQWAACRAGESGVRACQEDIQASSVTSRSGHNAGMITGITDSKSLERVKSR